jgi:hypothetical protein
LPLAALPGLPAPACPGPRQAAWNRRLARYRRLVAQMEAEAATGGYRAANDDYAFTVAALGARFGSWEKACRSKEGGRLCETALDRLDEAEDAYARDHTTPMLKAAVLLALTPAPNLHALLLKIGIMHEHQLEMGDDLTRHPLEVVQEDVRRLASAANASGDQSCS